jgi:hypothetical protein
MRFEHLIIVRLRDRTTAAVRPAKFANDIDGASRQRHLRPEIFHEAMLYVQIQQNVAPAASGVVKEPRGDGRLDEIHGQYLRNRFQSYLFFSAKKRCDRNPVLLELGATIVISPRARPNIRPN